MTTYHALEIVLTRPLTAAELRRAAQDWPLAANHDTSRLMTVAGGRSPERAVHRLHQRLTGHLPIDVITTHYPDAHGRVLLNVDFPPDAHTTLQQNARRAGLTPERFVRDALHRALAEHADREADRLDHAVRQLLDSTNPAHLLSAVGHALTRPLKGRIP
ncbi:hypothetical protein ABZ646_00565 [Streptomyces sp. NPDC007162]|uniref:hypothetical protein n=1 Tax=Streptomyces sp. NPDC007162 TaxID=3156917 RepID=UPI0033F5C5A0